MTEADNPDVAYSEVADQQLDDMEAAGDVDLYNAVLDACELVFTDPGRAQRMSTTIVTLEGTRLVLPVVGQAGYKVFWSSPGPRIEAVFPWP